MDTTQTAEQEIPTFAVVPDGTIAVKFQEPCPYCRKPHIHGIDSVGGHVVAHCFDAVFTGAPGETRPKQSPLHKTGYYLAWADGYGPEGEG